MKTYIIAEAGVNHNGDIDIAHKLIDEATSSLDSESENRIQESINSLQGQITLIIIAHRLSTIKNVDTIYLIDDGKIIESGTFDELNSNLKN